jgi:hypothetical protein
MEEKEPSRIMRRNLLVFRLGSLSQNEKEPGCPTTRSLALFASTTLSSALTALSSYATMLLMSKRPA